MVWFLAKLKRAQSKRVTMPKIGLTQNDVLVKRLPLKQNQNMLSEQTLIRINYTFSFRLHLASYFYSDLFCSYYTLESIKNIFSFLNFIYI